MTTLLLILIPVGAMTIFFGLYLLVLKVIDHYDRKACREGAKRLMEADAGSLFESEDDCYEFLLRTLKAAHSWRRI